MQPSAVEPLETWTTIGLFLSISAFFFLLHFPLPSLPFVPVLQCCNTYYKVGSQLSSLVQEVHTQPEGGVAKNVCGGISGFQHFIEGVRFRFQRGPLALQGRENKPGWLTASLGLKVTGYRVVHGSGFGWWLRK